MAQTAHTRTLQLHVSLSSTDQVRYRCLSLPNTTWLLLVMVMIMIGGGGGSGGGGGGGGDGSGSTGSPSHMNVKPVLQVVNRNLKVSVVIRDLECDDYRTVGGHAQA